MKRFLKEFIKRIIVLLLVIAQLLPVYNIPAAHAADKKDSKIRFNDFYGEVKIRPDSEEDDSYEFVDLDTVIYEGDRIKTEEDSGAILGLEDMSTYVIKPDSTLIIHTDEGNVSKIEMLAGSMWGNIKKMAEGKSLEIEMSQCVCGINGTTIYAQTSVPVQKKLDLNEIKKDADQIKEQVDKIQKDLENATTLREGDVPIILDSDQLNPTNKRTWQVLEELRQAEIQTPQLQHFDSINLTEQEKQQVNQLPQLKTNDKIQELQQPVVTDWISIVKDNKTQILQRDQITQVQTFDQINTERPQLITLDQKQDEELQLNQLPQLKTLDQIQSERPQLQTFDQVNTEPKQQTEMEKVLASLPKTKSVEFRVPSNYLNGFNKNNNNSGKSSEEEKKKQELELELEQAKIIISNVGESNLKKSVSESKNVNLTTEQKTNRSEVEFSELKEPIAKMYLFDLKSKVSYDNKRTWQTEELKESPTVKPDFLEEKQPLAQQNKSPVDALASTGNNSEAVLSNPQNTGLVVKKDKIDPEFGNNNENKSQTAGIQVQLVKPNEKNTNIETDNNNNNNNNNDSRVINKNNNTLNNKYRVHSPGSEKDKQESLEIIKKKEEEQKRQEEEKRNKLLDDLRQKVEKLKQEEELKKQEEEKKKQEEKQRKQLKSDNQERLNEQVENEQLKKQQQSLKERLQEAQQNKSPVDALASTENNSQSLLTGSVIRVPRKGPEQIRIKGNPSKINVVVNSDDNNQQNNNNNENNEKLSEEELKKQEEERQKQEAIKKEEEALKKQEEELKKQEEELKKQQEELKKQEEELKKQEEEIAKRKDEILKNLTDKVNELKNNKKLTKKQRKKAEKKLKKEQDIILQQEKQERQALQEKQGQVQQERQALQEKQDQVQQKKQTLQEKRASLNNQNAQQNNNEDQQIDIVANVKNEPQQIDVVSKVNNESQQNKAQMGNRTDTVKVLKGTATITNKATKETFKVPAGNQATIAGNVVKVEPIINLEKDQNELNQQLDRSNDKQSTKQLIDKLNGQTGQINDSKKPVDNMLDTIKKLLDGNATSDRIKQASAAYTKAVEEGKRFVSIFVEVNSTINVLSKRISADSVMVVSSDESEAAADAIKKANEAMNSFSQSLEALVGYADKIEEKTGANPLDSLTSQAENANEIKETIVSSNGEIDEVTKGITDESSYSDFKNAITRCEALLRDLQNLNERLTVSEVGTEALAALKKQFLGVYLKVEKAIKDYSSVPEIKTATLKQMNDFENDVPSFSSDIRKYLKEYKSINSSSTDAKKRYVESATRTLASYDRMRRVYTKANRMYTQMEKEFKQSKFKTAEYNEVKESWEKIEQAMTEIDSEASELSSCVEDLKSQLESLLGQ